MNFEDEPTPVSPLPFSSEFLAAYDQLRLRGEGGMGTVYAARDKKRGIDVAIKVLKGVQSTDLSRFAREARVLSALHHPNIIQFLESGTDGVTQYMVCEFIDGPTLMSELDSGPIVIGRVLEILGTVAEALAFAHSQNVIHRDVKPENILLTRTGKVKLGDFGLVRDTSSNSMVTSSGVIMGTPAYMSPEQALGHRVGPETDQYALGVMGYRMVTGALPFVGKTPMEQLLARLHSDAIPPSRRVQGLPLAVNALIVRAMSREVSGRFQSMGHLLQEIERVLENLGPDGERAYHSPPGSSRAVAIPALSLAPREIAAQDSAMMRGAAPASMRSGQPPVSIPSAGRSSQVADRSVVAAPKSADPNPDGTRRSSASGRVSRPSQSLAHSTSVGADRKPNWWLLVTAVAILTLLIFFDGLIKSPGRSGVRRNEPREDSGPDGTRVSSGTGTTDRSQTPRRLQGVSLYKTDVLGGMFGSEPYTDLAPESGLLVGIEVGLGKFFNSYLVHSIRAIFRVGDEERLGPQHGTDLDQVTRLCAKPGYAVGAMTVEAGGNADGLSLTFMRIKGEDLDPNDQYESGWIGDPGPNGHKKLTGRGNPIVGIVGLQSNKGKKDNTGIGLVLGQHGSVTENDAPEGAQ